MREVTRKDKIRSEYVKGSTSVASILDNMGEDRLRRFRHVMRKQETKVATVMKMNVERERGKKRPKMIWLDTTKNDLGYDGFCGRDLEDRDKWRFRIMVANPK